MARGVAERVFELEADAGGRSSSGLLEVDLRGPFTFPQLGGLKQKTIEIRGKADRIDVFDDGTLRVVDYKLGRLPDLETLDSDRRVRALRRAVLEPATDGSIRCESAMYLAFGDDRKLEGPLGSVVAAGRHGGRGARVRVRGDRSSGSRPASFRRRPRGRRVRSGAATPACAARNTCSRTR